MTPEEQLAAAQAALHRLLTGSAREEVQTDDGRVRYFQPDVNKLKAYIAQLQDQIACRSPGGAIGIVF